MPKPIKRLLPLTLLYWICPVAFGQQYPFLPVAGSPKAVKELFQDSRGRLWLGGSGLACFDGSRFFFLRNYGLPAGDNLDVAEDPSGAIWIGTTTGLYRFWNGRVDEISKGAVFSVVPISPDAVVAAVGPPERTAASTTSLVRLQRSGAVWKAETVMNLDSPGPLTLDRGGFLLYPWPGKGWSQIRLADVAQWHAGARVTVEHHSIPFFASNPRMKVMRDRDGCVWAGGPGLNIYDCGDGPHPALPSGARLEFNFHEASDGTMVLWGNSLLAVGHKGSFRVASPTNGLPGLSDAIPGNDGTVWLASPEGLYRFASPFRLEYWTAREGLSDAPWSVTRSGGRIYAGLDRRIMALSADRLRWETVASFEKGGLVSSLVGDDLGTLLAAFMEGGVIQLGTDGRVLARTGSGYPGGSMRLLRTPGGEIWVGGHLLQRLARQGTVLKFETHQLQTKGNVLAVKYEEHTRKLWACYNGGAVVRDENRRWREITTGDGLLVNDCWSLAPLPNGDVWYAYRSAPSIALIRSSAAGGITVRQYGSRDGIPEPGGDTLDADQRGRLWRAGDLGIYAADPAEAEAGSWLQLGELDGFPANAMNSGSYFTDRDGSLWWGADNDLVHYTPPVDLVTPAFAPQVFVSAFSWSGSAPKLAEAVADLPHGSAVVAHIGSLQFNLRNGLRLRYRVLPGQSSWRESKNLDLVLGKLSSGTHTLEVQARVFTGPWSRTASRSFTVLRPVWLTWPLLLAYTFTGVTLLIGDQLLRRRRLVREQQLLPNLKAWRQEAVLPELRNLTGTLLDSRYEVGELLSRGGFASVRAGYDRAEERRCAIKVFSEVKNRAWIMRSFEREVAALQRICHPNVVSIYAHGIAPSGAPYLVMEFVEGKNLREILEDGPLSPMRTARLVRHFACALDAIHGQGICHRDVKPENIIVRHEKRREEQGILVDFSIAIIKDANETLHGLSRAEGTFDYMAPEQVLGYAEPSSDVYSLAKLVIEMLTGNQVSSLLPNAALDLPAQARELLRNLEKELGVKFSEESLDMLATALEFDPSKRPNAAGLFAEPIVRDLESPKR